MHQLTGTDAVFLAMETTDVHAHTGGLMILDPSAAAGFGYERFRDTVAERIPEVPKFLQVLHEVPFGLDRAYLVDDPSFDVDRHLHRIAVPSPGGREELATLCGYLFSQKLDRRRPLWEMWFIEGLADGRVAILAKTHHCLMDGVSGAALGQILCDLEPEPRDRPRADVPAAASAHRPGDLEVLARAAGNLLATPVRLGQLARRSLRFAVGALPHLYRNGVASYFGGAPRLGFNRQIGPERAFASASVPLADMKALKNGLDVKLNDVILELCGSAIRRYLERNDEVPREALTAICPVSTRDAGDEELGNHLAMMIVSCATDCQDPIERVRAIHESAARAKTMTHGMTKAARDAGLDVSDVFPPFLINWGFRAAMTWAEVTPLPGNVMISNVPGPPIPLYTAGARIEALYPLSLLTSGQGLNITVISFIDRIDFGFTVDPDLVTDPWYLADGIPAALAELRAAAGRAGVDMPEHVPTAQETAVDAIERPRAKHDEHAATLAVAV